MGLFSTLSTLAHGAQPESYVKKKQYIFESELGKPFSDLVSLP